MNLPMPNLRHLIRMTDETGLFEHACEAVPRRAHGYCSDDAGRALGLTCRWADPTADRLSEIYLAFLSHLHLGGGRFALRLGHDRRLIDGDVSDDACGRAIFGLGVAAASTAPRHVTEEARELFCKTTSFRSRWPHAMAYAALGAAAVLADDPDQLHVA
ncbi:MAG: glycosyltransferase, partial [Mycobacterium sp.]